MDWLKPRAASPAAAEFDRLVREHVPAFYRSAYRWVGNAERAEDLVQELLLRLFPLLDQLRTLDTVRPWAMRVMYRIFVDQLRRERSSPVRFGLKPALDDESEEDGLIVDEADEPPALVEQQLTRERLARAWAKLSDEYRVVLSMHEIEGYTLVELSTMMDVPVGTLKSRLHRGRTRLKELLRTQST